jgi:radical SAM superfamily enzyme YgiQ (UPF0313 family)
MSTTNATELHPKGRSARVLLTSVFGPYAQDDDFGSRAINPMELYHNQVTRAQGAYSVRMFHRSWGIMMIQHNISAPCTVLDFPDRRAFAKELKRHSYDIVGISSIIVNVGKVREMCRMVRRISPRSVVVVGGHVAAISGLPDLIDADHIVRGDGISWMRRYLGESDTAPIRHPPIPSGLDLRVMGFRVPASTRSTAATLIPAVGCPMGCNFCTTSAFFGGKGKFLDFYHSSDEIFAVMEEIESKMKVRSFFIMDENFLLRRKRTMELLARMKEKAKTWSFYVFSSVNAIRKYSMEELVELGVSWLWLGLESPRAGYAKLRGTDTQQLAREFRAHGIKLLGSTIVGLEHHTPENIGKEIDYAVAHETDFHQFMLYTPMPGTPLYREMEQQGRLLPVDLADTHGQYRFNFKHAAISRKESTGFLEQAFRKDFEQNGPSIYRICRTTLEGWKRYRNHPDLRIRQRFGRDVRQLKTAYSAALWAMEHRLRSTNQAISAKINALRREVETECGASARWAARIFGPLLVWTIKREEKRLARGRTHEPRTFRDRANWSRPGWRPTASGRLRSAAGSS